MSWLLGRTLNTDTTYVRLFLNKVVFLINLTSLNFIFFRSFLFKNLWCLHSWTEIIYKKKYLILDLIFYQKLYSKKLSTFL